MPRGQFRMRRCTIAGVEAVEVATSHSFVRHTHDRFGIGVIDRGAQRSLSGRGIVEAGAGDTITVNPGEVHDGAPIGEGGRSWRILYFDQALVADAVHDMTEGRTASYEFDRPVHSGGAVAVRQAALFEALTTGGDALRWQELLPPLLVELGDRPAAANRGAGVPDAIGPARAMIDDDPAAAITLAEMADACGLSRFQLLRGFAKHTGMTPHAYLVQRRIDTARRLIAGGLPLAEAAAAAGFSDQSHMTRIFVRKYGVSPGAYAAAFA